MAKYIFVTGGVTSSLGKGIIAASLAKLLQARGFRVTIQKLDPYINIDPGTLNPYEHGECYVTEDGAETASRRSCDRAYGTRSRAALPTKVNAPQGRPCPLLQRTHGAVSAGRRPATAARREFRHWRGDRSRVGLLSRRVPAARNRQAATRRARAARTDFGLREDH